MQYLLTERLVLTPAGGALGLPIAVLATRAFVALAPPGLPRVAEVAIDGRVALCALGLSLGRKGRRYTVAECARGGIGHGRLKRGAASSGRDRGVAYAVRDRRANAVTVPANNSGR